MGPPVIVVGVDRSEDSAAALRTAMDLAADLGARLVVIHAVGLLEASGYREPPPVEDLVAACRADADDRVPVTIERVDGAAADTLVRVAAEQLARLVVVGRRGLGNAPRPLGSVSEAVLARSTRPVLVVPSAAVDGDAPGPTARTDR